MQILTNEQLENCLLVLCTLQEFITLQFDLVSIFGQNFQKFYKQIVVIVASMIVLHCVWVISSFLLNTWSQKSVVSVLSVWICGTLFGLCFDSVLYQFCLSALVLPKFCHNFGWDLPKVGQVLPRFTSYLSQFWPQLWLSFSSVWLHYSFCNTKTQCIITFLQADHT